MEDTLTPTIDQSDPDDSLDANEAVVAAVAERKGISPLEVEPPLATVVDPDSLNALVESTSDAVAVTSQLVEFTYSGHRVAVTADGEVSVGDPDVER